MGRYGTAGYNVKAQKFVGEEWPEVAHPLTLPKGTTSVTPRWWHICCTSSANTESAARAYSALYLLHALDSVLGAKSVTHKQQVTLNPLKQRQTSNGGSQFQSWDCRSWERSGAGWRSITRPRSTASPSSS